MHAFSVNYLERDGGRGLLNRGFWLHGVHRPLIWCRLFGHKPVVDGYGPSATGLRAARWVECGRCAVRPDPQGDLDPAEWPIGASYTGRFMFAIPDGYPQRDLHLDALKRHVGHYPPGPWSNETIGTLGGQIVLGRHLPTLGFTLKVGNKGSEHTLAADFHLPWIGSLYLHTERFGSWWVRRLNGVGSESKVISVEAHGGRLWWKLWADRNGGWRSKATRWERLRNGSVQIDPRTLLLGPKRYSYADRGDKVPMTVRMPHGDDHQVQLQLQQVTYGRRRGRKRLSWSVDWSANPGIPTKPGGRGRIYGSAVDVSDVCVVTDTWRWQAAVRIAERLTEDRRRNDWQPTEAVPA